MTRHVQILMGLAGAWLGILQPGRSQGTVAYFQPATPIFLHTEGFTTHYPLDLDADGNVDFVFTYSYVFLGVRSEGANRILIFQDPPPNFGGPIAPLPAGFSIGPASQVDALLWWSGFVGDYDYLASYYNGGGNGPFAGQQAYMGFEFQRAGGTHYGWISLYVDGFISAVVIDSWAYETRPNTAIIAGAKPVMVGVAVPVVVRAGFLRLSWLSEIGKAYQVLSKASLDAPGWTNLNFAVPATSTNTLLDLPRTGATQFFRVVEAD